MAKLVRDKKASQVPNKHRRSVPKGLSKASATQVSWERPRSSSRPKLEQGMEGFIPNHLNRGFLDWVFGSKTTYAKEFDSWLAKGNTNKGSDSKR